MLVDLGKLIRNQVPDKDGDTLPPDLTSGAYRIRDLTDTAVGNLYEGKVIVDKTYGHAAYGCGICCGYVDALMGYDPLGVAVASSSAQQVYTEESCGGGTVLLTEDFPTWSTGNTSIGGWPAFDDACLHRSHRGCSILAFFGKGGRRCCVCYLICVACVIEATWYRHFRLPPFAKCAKNGVSTFSRRPGKSKAWATRQVTRV